MAELKNGISVQKKTQRAFSEVNKSVQGLEKNFSRMKGIIGALVGCATLGALTKNLLSLGDRIGKVIAQIGISTEVLQKYRFAAAQSGISSGLLDTTL